MRDWLIDLRKNLGVTQKDVAQRAGLAQPSYCDIEKGRNNPSVTTAKKLAAVLGIEWTRFFEEG